MTGQRDISSEEEDGSSEEEGDIANEIHVLHLGMESAAGAIPETYSIRIYAAAAKPVCVWTWPVKTTSSASPQNCRQMGGGSS